jgi:flavin-dependent dehydrogenase
MPDPVIVGGGPAGAAAAIMLARAGRAVTLIERDAAPADKVCGDFLGADAVRAIRALGVDVAALSPSPIDAVRLVHGNRMASAPLPFAALGLTRRALDAALLNAAQRRGATVLRGHRVRGVSQYGEALRLDCASLGPIVARTVFLASGKHDVRGAPRPAHGNGLVGMKMYFALDARQRAALRGHVELILFSGGYAGLQLVESDRAVLCMLVPASRVRAAPATWPGLLDSLMEECPHLADRLAGARPLRERPVAVARLPYGYLHASAPQDWPGLFRLGDQASVIGSFAGDGVALALGSAALAARVWLAGGNASGMYHRAWRSQVASQIRASSLINDACLSAATQPWLLRLCRLSPRLMRLVAARTRMRITPP